MKAYEHKYGKAEVETFLDAALAIQEHIDPSIMRPKLAWSIEDLEEDVEKKKISQYDDLWNLDDRNKRENDLICIKRRKFRRNQRKIYSSSLKNMARELEDWQRDILTMMREEMLYFWPQLETKIMNEGWASYWHQRILREMDLTSSEAIEFAKLNAGVVQPSKTSINPYYLGIKMFEDIEERYNNPTEEMKRRGVKPGSGRQNL